MIAYIVTAAISVSAGVLGMGMWRGRKHIAALSERDRARIDYATERRKRLEAEQAHTDLADKHSATRTRIENVITLIDSIPHRKGKETRIKAMLRGEAA